ncbi:MAG: hypothetical protein AB1705_18725, partial [Verrucomicrobiota bacterium]
EKLQKASLKRDEALRDLAKVSDSIKEQAKELAKNPALRRMEQAARQNAEGQPGAAAMQKQIEEMQKALGKAADKSSELNKLKKQLEQLKQTAESMAKEGGGLSQEEQEQLSQSLAALSQQAAELGANIPNLEQAMAALAAQDAGLFLKDLDLSLLDLEKLAEMAKKLDKLQGQFAKMGKDLPEQLKMGQAEIAMLRLRKMVKDLNSAHMNKEQMEKMLDEVSRSIDPAGPYGKVAEHLQKAADQLKAGQKPQAAQSLADAAKEIEELLKQMGDCENMNAMMMALQRAGMSIGNCQGWGQCMGPGGFNMKGSRPGRGVGTWADEDGGLDSAEFTGLWDNSGIERPDMDGKGLTDRDANVRNDMTPDKVKGQFSPGGQMPSITLKGVSIKGESKVAYQEAVAAAQSEAESALNQDKVPRAYQGAVKGYFDDFGELKK